MCRGVLDNKAFIPFDSLEDMRFLDSPLTNVGPLLIRLGVLLLGVRWLPSRLPIISKLFEEWSFDRGWLDFRSVRWVQHR